RRSRPPRLRRLAPLLVEHLAVAGGALEGGEAGRGLATLPSAGAADGGGCGGGAQGASDHEHASPPPTFLLLHARVVDRCPLSSALSATSCSTSSCASSSRSQRARTRPPGRRCRPGGRRRTSLRGSPRSVGGPASSASTATTRAGGSRVPGSRS